MALHGGLNIVPFCSCSGLGLESSVAGDLNFSPSFVADPSVGVLVTGFGAFGPFEVNPSWEVSPGIVQGRRKWFLIAFAPSLQVMKTFDGAVLDGRLKVAARQLPVEYGQQQGISCEGFLLTLMLR